MARILICHVPKDGGLARDLGALLMGRGHFVSFDGEPDVPKEDRSARLRQFEAVIVVWTELSAQSVGLSDIASETLPLNILVPVRSETLSAHELPLKFRKLNMFGPRDIDGLSRLVARLSHAQTSLKEMTAREAQRELQQREAPHSEPVYQRPIVPQMPARTAPQPEPQKPPLPVFVKQRLPASPPPPEPVVAAAPPVQPVERPAFPPKMAAPRTPDHEPPRAAAPAAAAPPLPPFVTRRLTASGASVPAAAVDDQPKALQPREIARPAPRTTQPSANEASGPEMAWKALAEELNEPANPVVAPTLSRPHAPRGRTPIVGRTTQAHERREERAVPAPVTQAPPPPAPEPQRIKTEAAPSYASLRPQPVAASTAPPSIGSPPPLPSRDGLGAGSPSFSAVAMAQHLARLVEAGLLLIYIPEATWLGEPITTEVRLGREVLDDAAADPRLAADRITIDTISVSLISDDPGFSIERQSERTQFVGQRFHDHKSTTLTGRWAWLVTPHTPGDFDLIIRISALVRDRSGVPTPVALPDRRYSIAIHAREARAR